jgi:general secretion pathway protein G
MKKIFWIVLLVSLESFGAGTKSPVDAKVQDTQVKLEHISNSLFLYKHDCSRYPEKLTSLQQNLENCKNWGPEPYASASSQFQDAWGNDISYTPNEKQFTLKSLGADRKVGGTGANSDLIKQAD